MVSGRHEHAGRGQQGDVGAARLPGEAGVCCAPEPPPPPSRFSVSNDLKYDAERDLRDIEAPGIAVHALSKVEGASCYHIAGNPRGGAAQGLRAEGRSILNPIHPIPPPSIPRSSMVTTLPQKAYSSPPTRP